MYSSSSITAKDRMRRLVKSGLAVGLSVSGVDKVIGARRGARQTPLILGYHRVVENFSESATRSIAPMLVSTQTLEKHLDWVGKYYEFVSLDDLADIRMGKRQPTKPVAALTFDDGYADVYSNAFPMLSRKGIPSAVFVVSDLVGSTKLQFHDELFLVVSTAIRHWENDSEAQLRQTIDAMELEVEVVAYLKTEIDRIRDPFAMMRLFFENLNKSDNEILMQKIRDQVPVSENVLREFHSFDWDMLAEMAKRDVTIGSHSKTHALLANEDWETVVNEVTVSRSALEQGLGFPVKHFAYPDGRFNAMSVKAVAEAGYQGAYTICTHQDQDYAHLTIPRKVLWENSCIGNFGQFSPSILSCMSNGIFDPARACDQHHSI